MTAQEPLRMRHGAICRDGSVAFGLWAPRLPSVELHLLTPRDELVSMARGDDGWHTVVVRGLAPGARYLYRLPDGAELPDPASRLQAETVHGPSVVVDRGFAWRDQDFPGLGLEDLVLYELHVGTFTAQGTFDAVIPHLAGLRELGVTAIELMPVAQFPGRRNWGYDGVLPFAVQNSYGGPAGLQRLVAACHDIGLGVVMDVVHNHVGPEGNHLARFGPYFTDACRTPWGEAMNFDGGGSDEVRRFFIESALCLLADHHIDGLRIDAVHAIRDWSAHPFLQELTAAVHARAAELGRKVLVIAESDLNDARVLLAGEQGGLGMDAQWSDDFHHALHAHATGERQGYYADFGAKEQVALAYRQGWIYDGTHSRYRERRHGNSPHGVPARRFVVFTQNHDQVGNRALGDRLGTGDLPLQRLLAVALLLSPFTPLLFMGQEYGETAPFHYFVDHGDAALVEAVRRGRREEFAGFGWDPEQLADPAAEATFVQSRLDHGLCRHAAHRGLRDLHRELLRLRAERAALRGSTGELEAVAPAGMVVVRRWSDDDELVFALVFGEGGELAGYDGWRVLLDTEDPRWRGEAGDGRQGATVAEALRPVSKSAIVLVRREATT
ncbi:MAG TPA: malto-oligosyltrehalose trehalohydrolase [Planctomycetota bacterium]|nr:malto-oligosyltrehalose trehalohydrolase [Planctomycetota bacterium]